MMQRINQSIERYRLDRGWGSLSGKRLEDARSYAMKQWAKDHHADFDAGPYFPDIKNLELESNLGGKVDMDWLASVANRGAGGKWPFGTLTYLAGKTLWLFAREEKPDRASFASTYPDTNWRAVSAADLLLSGKASVEEVFVPGKETPLVRNRLWQHEFQHVINESIPGLSSKEKPEMKSPGGVTMKMRVGTAQFQGVNLQIEGALCVSLRALSTQAAGELRAGGLSANTAWLGGLNWVDAILPDADNRDLIIAGRVLPNRPGIHLDDVAVLLSGAGGEAPYCSLDPAPENVLRVHHLMKHVEALNPAKNLDSTLQRIRETLGGQKVVLGNVPPSRVAETMVLADYDMKRLSQGLLGASGLESTTDLFLSTAREAIKLGHEPQSGGGMSRFWFCLAEDQPKFGTNRMGAIWLDSCKVVVRTERQLATTSGNLFDAHGAKDEIAEAFASRLSERFDEVSAEHPSLAGLENMFRLRALFEAAAFLRVLESADLKFLQREYPLQDAAKLPGALPGLANGKVMRLSKSLGGGRTATFVFAPIVCGGVHLDTPVAPKRLAPMKTVADQTCVKAIQLRFSPGEACWGIPR